MVLFLQRPSFVIKSVYRQKLCYGSTLILDNYSTSTSSPKDYSSTLCLPKTKFSMRYEAKKIEDQYRDRVSTELYKWQQVNNKDNKEFVLHDGPPYANGKLHTGHAMNKVLKDIINRYKLLRGYKIKYIPGWDCHGLPIELKALAKQKNKKLTPLEIRKYARDSALEAIEDQMKDLKHWSIMADWSDIYRTLSTDYVVRQLKIFKDFIEKGYVYRQYKPVYWSPSTMTALAEGELEYNDQHVSTSAYIRFLFKDMIYDVSSSLEPNIPVYALIWTTTPWTIPSNKAIALHPEMSYSFSYSEKDHVYYLVSESSKAVLEEFMGPLKTVKHIKGNMLEGLQYTNPINGEVNKVILADYVTEGSGTGLVHNAPSHGMEDYKACQAYNIPVVSLVNQYGKFTKEAGPELEGKPVLGEGNQKVLELLDGKSALVFKNEFIHSYPYDWRSKKPVIQRATAQWFINVSEITGRAISRLEEVETIPASGKNRLSRFLLSRNEWCISRQRSWGVPIPVFYDENGAPLLCSETINHIIQIIEKEGPDAWWSKSVEELLPEIRLNEGKKYTKGLDTMDVWFDSGTSWSLLDNESSKDRQSIYDLCLEGSDQHRGWFQSSLLTAIGTKNKSPYSTLITHGFLLDDKGVKMSKSIGNVISPSLIIEGGGNKKLDPAYGVDGMRFWIASSDYTKEVSLGRTVMKSIHNSVSKVRNTARFIIANLDGFKESEAIKYDQLNHLDKGMLYDLYHFNEAITSSFDSFRFNQVMQELYKFAANASAFYCDVSKDRLYADAVDSLSRKSVQTVLFHILNSFLRILAPIAPHTAEEIYEHSKFAFLSPPESASHLGWFENIFEWDNKEVGSKWMLIKELRKNVNLLVEKARGDKHISNPLELEVTINVNNSELFNLLSSLENENNNELSSAFLVSKLGLINKISHSEKQENTLYEQDMFLDTLDLLDNKQPEPISIKVKKVETFKCPRCWVYKASAPGVLCSRCQSVVKNMI